MSYIAILQRVLSASVTVDKQLISSIGKGILVFVAVAPGDAEKDVESLAAKVLKMKLWDDNKGGRVEKHSTCTYIGIEINLIRVIVEAKCSRYQWRDSLW